MAIAAVSRLGYLGSFAGPVLIAAVAQRTSLSAALVLLVAGVGSTLLLARRGGLHDAGSRAQVR